MAAPTRDLRPPSSIGDDAHLLRPSGSLFAAAADAGQRLQVLLVNGVNLSQLHSRNPLLYGTLSLEQLVADLRAEHRALDAFNSEHEGAIVERIHRARSDGTDAVVINPGAMTHYSYAIRDALELIKVPKVEVHLTHTLGRDHFRRYSTVTPVVDATITGLGALGYRLAIRVALSLALEQRAAA